MIAAPLAQLRDEVAWVAAAQSKEHEPLWLDLVAGNAMASCGPVWNYRTATFETDGEAIPHLSVPARVFADWLATQRGQEVSLTIEDGRLVAKARGVCRLPLLKTSRFSPAMTEPAEHWFTTEGDDLRSALAAVQAHARGVVDSSQHAWEMSVHLSAGQVFGGSPYSAALVGPSGTAESVRVQMDRRQLREALSGATGPVEVSRSDNVNLLWLSYGNRTAQLGVQDYRMPDVTRLFDQDRDLQLEVSAPDLLAAVKSVSIETDVIDVVGAHARPVLLLDGRQSSKGLDPAGQATAEVGYVGDNFSDRLDAGFLSAALSTIDGTARICWSSTAPRRPILIESEDSPARHVLATIRKE